MEIVFTTFNARYSHTALALRCLRAALGGLRDRSIIIEFDNVLSPHAAAEKLLAHEPQLVLFSVYIWNLTIVSETAAILKTVRPEIRILIGGPEVSYDYEELTIFRLTDHLICGEGETVIEEVCRTLFEEQGRRDACGTEEERGRRDACDTEIVPQASRLPVHSGFNPYREINRSRRKNLPHWTQDGCTYFVTFRLADSIARTRIDEYNALREKWEAHHHPPYSEAEQKQFAALFSDRVNDWLDEGAGACILRNPDVSKRVAEVLCHFDGERYILDEWVVMPNHVHALVKPLPGFELETILHSWKSYSAHQINKLKGKEGPVWKRESYDHIVRDQDELIRIRKYIRENPAKAGVCVAHSGGRRDACDTDVPQASRLPKVIHAPPADPTVVALPYDEYTDEDIAHRRMYVETSRGCPRHCEYCLSSLDNSVRFFPPERIFPMFRKLIERGARIFKLIDRSFNINPSHAAAVLNFFLANRRDGMMLHLEWEPEHLPPSLEKILAGAPEGFLQLEVGVQTFNPAIARRIRRPLHPEQVEKNIRTLAAMPSVHLHADLIAGLPGEGLESIAAGFDRLHACGPDEIQLGVLKKLRGTSISRHDVEWQMVYNTSPPYDVLQTATLSFPELQRIRRFARFWDITVNNGRFPSTAPLIWRAQPSVFAAFMEWSDFLYAQTHATAGFTPGRLARFLETFLTRNRRVPPTLIRQAIERDLNRKPAGISGMERQSRTSAH